MRDNGHWFWWIYWVATWLVFEAMTVVLFTYTAVERTMGPIQKIFYVHLPAAINAFAACLVVFLASVGFLWQRKMLWDDLAAAAARVAVLMCSVVLATGMIWGRLEWSTWWDWSPRLTFSLLLWLLYVVYLIIRPSVESRQRRAAICAVYGIAAFLDVPLVWLSTRLMPKDIHPSAITLEHFSMKLTLALWFIPMTLLTAGLIAVEFRRQRRRTARLHALSSRAN